MTSPWEYLVARSTRSRFVWRGILAVIHHCSGREKIRNLMLAGRSNMIPQRTEVTLERSDGSALTSSSTPSITSTTLGAYSAMARRGSRNRTWAWVSESFLIMLSGVISNLSWMTSAANGNFSVLSKLLSHCGKNIAGGGYITSYEILNTVHTGFSRPRIFLRLLHRWWIYRHQVCLWSTSSSWCQNECLSTTQSHVTHLTMPFRLVLCLWDDTVTECLLNKLQSPNDLTLQTYIRRE